MFKKGRPHFGNSRTRAFLNINMSGNLKCSKKADHILEIAGLFFEHKYVWQFEMFKKGRPHFGNGRTRAFLNTNISGNLKCSKKADHILEIAGLFFEHELSGNLECSKKADYIFEMAGLCLFCGYRICYPSFIFNIMMILHE